MRGSSSHLVALLLAASCLVYVGQASFEVEMGGLKVSRLISDGCVLMAQRLAGRAAGAFCVLGTMRTPNHMFALSERACRWCTP